MKWWRLFVFLRTEEIRFLKQLLLGMVPFLQLIISFLYFWRHKILDKMKLIFVFFFLHIFFILKLFYFFLFCLNPDYISKSPIEIIEDTHWICKIIWLTYYVNKDSCGYFEHWTVCETLLLKLKIGISNDSQMKSCYIFWFNKLFEENWSK